MSLSLGPTFYRKTFFRWSSAPLHLLFSPIAFTLCFPFLNTPLSISWIPRSRRKGRRSISVGEIRVKFREFAASLVGNGISLFTNGSRRIEDDEDSTVGAAVYSPDLHLALKHKLPPETSIFSAEAWAIYQALILIESTSHLAATIFSDLRSVLDALSSSSLKSCNNYLIPLIRDKYHSLVLRGISIRFAWIPFRYSRQRKSWFFREAGRILWEET